MEYEVNINIKKKIIASDEEEALNKFWNDIYTVIEITNTDLQHFLDLNTKITPLQQTYKPNEIKKITLDYENDECLGRIYFTNGEIIDFKTI